MVQNHKHTIYSSTALASRQREIKDAAREGVVHITENGNGAFVFCSEEIFAEELEQAREEARYEAELLWAASRARADLAAGRYTDIEGLKAAAAQKGVASD